VLALLEKKGEEKFMGDVTKDDGTVVEKHTGHGKIGGEEFTFPTCTSYGIKDGKIFDVRVHTGDQHTVDRYMWAMFKLKGIPARLAE
jgi:hypothetical protein